MPRSKATWLRSSICGSARRKPEELAERLERTSDAKIEGLSHYVTEPAAERLAKTHPRVAAKVFRALCIRIIDAGKSKYYDEALANLEKAKNCYQRAGLDAQWQALIAEIHRNIAGNRALCRDSKG